MTHRPVGETLRAQGLVSTDQLRIALQEQATSTTPIGQILVGLGFITEAVLRDALSASLGQRSTDLSCDIPSQEALALISRDQAQRLRVLPLACDERSGTLTLAMSNPHDLAALDHVRGAWHRALGIKPDGEPGQKDIADRGAIHVRLAGDAEIERAIDQWYGQALSIDHLLREIETGQPQSPTLAHVDYQEDVRQPMVRLVEVLLADAVKQGASDIHFEPEEGFMRIRYRIDGLLRQIRALHLSYWPAMAVRLKVLAGMNIAETRAPQDGRFSLRIAGRSIDFRVSVQPVIHGENIVLRILDRDKGIVPLSQLGLLDGAIRQVLTILDRPEGLLIVAGPTGSGKTTTLYSLLHRLSTEHINIMTLEDPVEYPTALIRQTSIGEAVKLDFASGIRALLRQDPDVILVGEIRDEDTAAMALRAAMTGHRVLATLHAHSALGALPRLFDMGISAAMLSGQLAGILSQRLVRKLCPQCKTGRASTKDEQCWWQGRTQGVPAMVYRAVGCPACNQQGYRGRLAIMEILPIDENLDAQIAQRAPLGDLRRAAQKAGYVPLREVAGEAIARGDTSVEEVIRVLGSGSR
jgi:type IV pilus assembly protein PilB